MNALGATWRDQEQKKFAEALQQTTRALSLFVEAAGETPPNEATASASDAVAKYDRLAKDMVSVYATGDAEGMQRINQHYGRTSTVDDLRATVWRLVYKVRQAKGAAQAFQQPAGQVRLSSERQEHSDGRVLLESRS